MKVKNGDQVKVHYTGKLDDGEIFDTSRNRQPLEITVGDGNVIPGFEKAVIGMQPGDEKTFEVQPEEAYGPVRDELIVNVQKKDFPTNITPFVGQELQVRYTDGSLTNVVVADVEEDAVVLDANHPLAGKTLFFEVELVEIT